MSRYKIVISGHDEIDFVGHVEGVPAKVDSGAFRSAVHATDLKVRQRKGKKVLTGKLLGHRAYKQTSEFESEKFSRVPVRNSFGHEEVRYEIPLRVKVGPKIFTTSFTLADRSKNVYPVLMGCKLLDGRFLVDVSTSNVNQKEIEKLFDRASLKQEEETE